MLMLVLQGVVYEGREDLTPDNYLSEVAVPTDKRTLQEAVEGADVFLGLSVSSTRQSALFERCDILIVVAAERNESAAAKVARHCYGFMMAACVLCLQAGNLLTPEMLLSMARDPIVFACANPVPEIDPETGEQLTASAHFHCSISFYVR